MSRYACTDEPRPMNPPSRLGPAHPDNESTAMISAVDRKTPSAEPSPRDGTDSPTDRNGDHDWPALRLRATPAVEPFPLDVLPDPVAEFVEAVSRAIGCPPDFVAVPALVVAGAAIGRSAVLELKPGYHLSPALYAMSVGGPSSGKTPALKAAVAPLRDIDDRLHREYTIRKGQYEAEAEEYERAHQEGKPNKPIKPVLESVMVEDITTEALARKLANNPRGLLMARDEGSAFVASLGQYKGGRGSDRQFYMSAIFGAAIKQERKAQPDDPIFVPHPFLSVVGNLPPDMVETFREDHGRSDGFLERILFAFPEERPVPYWSAEGIPPEAIRPWAAIVSRLHGFPMPEEDGSAPFVVRPTAEAMSVWARGYNAHADALNSDDPEVADRAIEGKLRDFAPRLALILHALHVAAGTKGRLQAELPSIPASVMAGAIRLWGYFRSHHRRVRSYMHGRGLSGAPKGAQLVLRWIENHPGVAEFKGSDLSRAYPESRGYEPAMIEDGLQWLSARHCIRPADKLESTVRRKRRGRNPSRSWEVHPDLQRTLDNQGIQENPQPGDAAEDSAESPESPVICEWPADEEYPFDIPGEAGSSSAA